VIFRRSREKRYRAAIEEMGFSLLQFYVNVEWRRSPDCSHGHFPPGKMFAQLAADRFQLSEQSRQLRQMSNCISNHDWIRDLVCDPPANLLESINGYDEKWKEWDGRLSGPFPAPVELSDLVVYDTTHGLSLASYGVSAVDEFDDFVKQDDLIGQLVHQLGFGLVGLCKLQAETNTIQRI